MLQVAEILRGAVNFVLKDLLRNLENVPHAFGFLDLLEDEGQVLEDVSLVLQVLNELLVYNVRLAHLIYFDYYSL